MPKARDTIVRTGAQVEPPPPSETKSKPCMVTVLGFDNKDVLFRSDEVGAVQWRDSAGRLVAILARLKPDIWGFSMRGDDDWTEVSRIYGNADAPSPEERRE
jgi:hypothetical protein